MGETLLSSHLLSTNEASSNKTGLHLIELLAEGVPLGPQTTQAVAKSMDCSPQTDSKAPLPKTSPTQLIEHRQVKLVPTWSLYPYVPASLVQESTLPAIKREM